MPLSFRIEHTAVTGSTNDDLKQRARQGEPEGLVLYADRQTGGRGRLGRSFHSPTGSGLYASVLLRPDIPLADVNRITCLAAVCICQTVLDATGGSIGIKWVNDIYRNGRKVCGILTESAADTGGKTAYVVIGFGLNLCPPADGFPPEIAGIAGSVFDDAHAFPARRDAILDRILNGLSDYRKSLAEGTFLSTYRALSILCNTPVTVRAAGLEREAVALEVDACGRLRVRYHNGDEACLIAGDVSIRIQ